MTNSEVLFEKALSARGVAYQKIQEGNKKTPDYLVTFANGERSIWEIKELNENEDELEILSTIKNGKATSYSINSLRIENSISKAAKQFRAYDITIPCIVILFDSRDFFTKDLTFIPTLISILSGSSEFIVDKQEELIEIKRTDGYWSNNHKYISAVAVLHENGNFTCLHNPSAKNPLRIECVSGMFTQNLYFQKKDNKSIWTGT